MYAQGRYAFGFCDRCDRRYSLSDLKYEITDKRRNGLRVCPECLDEDHPQNFLGDVRVVDPQTLFDPRPDMGADASRKLMGWKPIGHPTTSLVSGSVGLVTVVTS